MNTPREVMFEKIYEHWGVSNKALARAIVLHDSVTSGKSPLELIEVRSSLSRFVVHVNPGENVYGWIAPYDQSVPRVLALLKHSKQLNDNASILGAMTGECAAVMRASLAEHGGDGALFANVARRIGSGEVASLADAAETAVALFVVAGCSGDAREAARYAIDMMRHLAMAAELRTQAPLGDETFTFTARATRIGLYRLSAGRLSGAPYPLSEAPEGTEIGSMSLAQHSINDVGHGISRRHARIWRDEAGVWWVEDLGSTNGTMVARSNGQRVVVSHPRAASGVQPAAGRVPIVPGDRIILAGKTEFSVVELAVK